ncbi:hypothetical protein [Legionella bononiensis]|uniref:Protein kinase domain-containing protein n=1 Tax=Legionella bononiensis TaxID=2793102 RepID=A0ABS1W766_9GAMM|nr:hypothetical protein [Legionella bononiensis]MBL7481303.1 hypothetical protein [Legionella bononiensis]MBL7525207.1 hypothetical protein [Legionella bononiensis]MBL7561390.1 hypothetical protein [Legionella bononiensis]
MRLKLDQFFNFLVTGSDLHKIMSMPVYPKPMELIKAFDAGALPHEAVFEFTRDVNQLIEEFNNTRDVDGKIHLLKEIQKQMKKIDYTYPQDLLANSPGYQKISSELFKSIQYQTSSLGIKSLLPTTATPTLLTEIIAQMAPEKAEQLVNILSGMGKRKSGMEVHDHLKNLYPLEDKSPEAELFREFLATHQISFLGGGNAKNFKVTHLKDNSTAVLKIDDRLYMPRKAEAHLREHVGNSLAVIDTERQVFCTNKSGEPASRTLLVTEYCSGGDLFSYGLDSLRGGEPVKTVSRVFEQMADVMLQIQDAGCMFPDAKITNWLINSDGKLIISDTKSFLFTDENQNFVPGIPGNEYCTLLSSTNFNPPEFYVQPVSINADSTHAYLLGKNIHRFITGSIQSAHDGSKFDFNYPFFKEGEGLEIRTLIEALVKPDPAERMPVKEALTQFFLMNNPEVKSLVKELKELKCGPKDKKMDEFIDEKIGEIRNATPQKREELISELKEIIKDLKADATVSEANRIVTNFRNNPDEFAMGINTRADKIEQEMVHIPIQERRTLHHSETSSVVKQAIESHHHLNKSASSDVPQANTAQVAATFKNYKERYAQQTHGNEDKVENEAEASSSIKVH